MLRWTSDVLPLSYAVDGTTRVAAGATLGLVHHFHGSRDELFAAATAARDCAGRSGRHQPAVADIGDRGRPVG